MGMRKLLSERRIKKMVIEITPKYLQSFGHTKENIYQYLEEFGFKSELMLDTWQYDEIFTLEN
ncbi:MAG: hypothetical protein M5T52_04180 [Ignavibacteriaceae bacterium]|nr:hypothetical protein [Ignavibacteriaceae bacterium]